MNSAFDKEVFIRRTFDAIAHRYDLMNMVMTAGAWRYWQWQFKRRNGVRAGHRVLDVGCGTADLCLLMGSQVGTTGRITGLDLSPEMLAVGRRKVERSAFRDRIRLVQGNALALPFSKGSFDVVTSGFVMRNVADLERALAEMVRVTRPGGRVVIIELSHPVSPLIRFWYRFYFSRIVPLMGSWAGGKSTDPFSPYSWLPASLHGFPDASGLAALMTRTGLADVSYSLLSGGIACLHWGFRRSA